MLYTATGQKVRIRTRKKLDYEYLPLRTVQLYVDYNDGFCNAETYSLTVKVTDVPEKPVILPATKFERTVYEGFVSALYSLTDWLAGWCI